MSPTATDFGLFVPPVEYETGAERAPLSVWAKTHTR
jgi:hypothetical protein